MLTSNFFKYVYFVVYSAHFTNCANILALVPATAYSHQKAFAPLWKTLSLRGHNVTLLTTDPSNDPKLTNLTELDIKWTYKLSENVTYYIENKLTMWNLHQVVFNTMYGICDSVLSTMMGQYLLRKENKFDLVLVEYLCPELLAFAEIHNCPRIMISSMVMPSIYYNLMGETAHPILQPEFVTPFHGRLNFKERLLSTLVTWYTHYLFAYDIFPRRQKLLRQYFNSTSTISELVSDVDMLFIGVNPLIHGPKAIGPATVTIGGYKEDRSTKPLQLDVKKFLDNAKEGCIYLSLGTNLKTSEISQGLLQDVIDALGEVPYKVLWKFEAEIPDLPKNIKTVKWVQQQKVLNHPNVKLFFCQGGLQSIEEGIYGEVPFVVIPFFSDQYQNARILENRGVGIVLNRKFLNKETLKNALLEVMTDSKFRNEVKKLKQLVIDEPMTGLEKAVWWTEYVIRNKGAKHLRNSVAGLPFYQYYLLDVIGLLLATTILAIIASTFTLKKIYVLLRKFYFVKEKTQ